MFSILCCCLFILSHAFCELAAVAAAVLALPVVQYGGSDDSLGHPVGVAVRGWSAVLQVTFALLPHLAGDADAGAAVGHAGRELVDAAGLVEPGESTLVVATILGVISDDVTLVVLAQLLDGFLDHSVTDKQAFGESDANKQQDHMQGKQIIHVVLKK